MNRLFSRSKSRTRQTPLDVVPPSYTYEGSTNGIPHVRSRANSVAAPTFYNNNHGTYYLPAVAPSQYPSSSSSMSYTSRSSAPTYYVPTTPYFDPHGHVVYPSGRKGYHLDESPLSSHREAQPRGRPRSSTAASEKLHISMAPSEPYRLALDGYASGPANPDGSKSGLFGSFMSSIRSRSKSKSRERDALFPARSSGSASYTRGDPRGRPIYEKGLHKEAHRDVGADLARQMEKDLRLQDMDDPYRQLRRDRSTSVNSRTSERRHRDLDPDVLDNTKYNAVNLKYSSNRMHSDSHRSSGYATDAQPAMMRRSTTSSRGNPAHGAAASLVGWYNQRGDQFIKPGTIICQPKELQYARRFERYPEVGKGYGDSIGNVIDVRGQLLKRVG